MDFKKNYLCHVVAIVAVSTSPALAGGGDMEAAFPTTEVVVTQDIASVGIGRATLRLIDISLDLLVAGGSGTADPGEIAQLQAGAHDPARHGFTIQNVELSMSGAVDPYFRADSFVILQIDLEGETVIELEEAYLTTLGLPGGLEIKGGMYFTEFGRINAQHPHAWSFVDQPIINSRIMGGDGLRAPGVRLSWVPATPWYLEWIAGLQNANGETAISFLASDEVGAIGGLAHSGRETESLADLLYTARWLNSFSLGDEMTLNVGVSGAFGPNAAGIDSRTTIAGGDIYLHWKPLNNERGWPFAALQVEGMSRWYDFDGQAVTSETLTDFGFYVQGLFGFAPQWVAGARYGHADARRGLRLDSSRDLRHRTSANVSWYPTEYSKLRLQYNYDDSDFIGTAHTVWLQAEVTIGAHAGHAF